MSLQGCSTATGSHGICAGRVLSVRGIGRYTRPPDCGSSCLRGHSAPCAQDFEALTPNLLARTIETVEGGGIVVMLLSTLRSLRELFSLTMDVHSRLRTESHQQVTGVPAASQCSYPDEILQFITHIEHCCLKDCFVSTEIMINL